MEFAYELLREACTYFLLSFLVVRFLSLIVSSTDDHKRVHLSTKIDHCYHNHVVGGDSFGGFDDKGVEFDEFKVVNDHGDETNNDKFEDVIVRDIDISSKKVNANKEDLRERFIRDVDDDQQVSKLVEFGGEFVDHGEKKIVGLDNKVAIADQSEETILDGASNLDDIGVNLERESEGTSNVNKGEVSGREFDVEDEGVLSDEEGWEGIERSELEKTFARAMNFVGCKKQEIMDNDVVMQFYGLQKVAMEGPCHEAQPLAIKRSARTKWNAWQKLGSMTREDAMEQYISLLSSIIPEWMEEDHKNGLINWKSGSSRTALDNSPEAN